MRDDLSNVARARLVRLGGIAKSAGKLDAPSGRTLLEVWEAYESRSDTPVTGGSFFEGYCRLRCSLGVQGRPHPQWVLEAYLKVFGEAAVRRRRVMQILGSDAAWEDAYVRLNEMTGRSYKRGKKVTPVAESEFFALLPEETREPFLKHLQRQVVPAIEPLDPLHMSRVLGLEGAALRLMAALAQIDATANRRAISTRKELIKDAEVQSGLLSGLDQSDPAIVERVLQGHLDSGGSVATVVPAVRDWFRQQRAARAVADEVLGEEAWRVVDLLPAYPTPVGDVATKLAEGLRALKKPKSEAATIKSVKHIIARLIDVQAAVENRVYQLEQIVKAWIGAMTGAQELLEAKLMAGFEWSGPVVRSDGSLGIGTQTVHFRLMTEAMLMERAAARGRRGALSDFMPGGRRHRPDHWTRLHVVYDRTEPDVVGGECVEPFFVELFRWGVFDPDRKHSDAASTKRLNLIADLQVSQFNVTVEGLLNHPASRKGAAFRARGPDPETGDIVIPLVEFFQAMSYARIVLRFGIRWGARIGETMQLRIGCTKVHDRDGAKNRPYVELKPKGWPVMGKFGMDVGTANAIAAARALANARWFDRRLTESGGPWLPDRPSGQGTRKDLPEAAYIFQTATRTVRTEEMTLFVRVLLICVVNYKLHDGRRVFATALGLDGVGYQQIGVLLHHSPQSAMPARYDLSALLVEDGAADRFNRALDAIEAGRVANA